MIRQATAVDASWCARLLGDWVRETGWMPVLHSREEDLGFVAGLIARTEVLVAEGGFLARERDEVLALYLAVNRWTQDEVLANYQISLPDWIGRLVKLDRLGIIELLPGNRARVLTARNFRWRTDGPMQRFFQERLLPEFFKSRFAGGEETLLLLSGMVSRRSAATIREKLREAASQFDLMLAQDAHLPAAERVGVSLVLAQRPWSLGLFDPLRKASADPALKL